jgi:hypothetical protein
MSLLFPSALFKKLTGILTPRIFNARQAACPNGVCQVGRGIARWENARLAGQISIFP